MGFEVGSILEGKVSGITKFGAFVTLPENRSGLVHISEIAYSYVNDVHDHLTEGQTVTVKVIGIDENNRINLSIKQALPQPPRQERGPGRRPAGGQGMERLGLLLWGEGIAAVYQSKQTAHNQTSSSCDTGSLI